MLKIWSQKQLKTKTNKGEEKLKVKAIEARNNCNLSTIDGQNN